jgi:hypothetical protein
MVLINSIKEIRIACSYAKKEKEEEEDEEICHILFI